MYSYVSVYTISPVLSVCVVAFQVICVAVLDIDPLWTAAGPSVR